MHTIVPTSPLPAITDPVTIDGYTQPGSAPNTNPVGQGLNGTLLIEIDGENAGNAQFGMIAIQTTDCTVRGLVINRTQGEEIGFNDGGVGNNLIEGNYIGTDATGTTSFPGVATGYWRLCEHRWEYDRRDHASRPQPDLGQGGAGVVINNASGYVQGNLIGTDVTGTRALGNGSGVSVAIGDPRDGSVVVGGPEAGAGNVISGNGGVGVSANNGLVQGNLIGTDVTGTLPIGNNIGAVILGDVTLASNTIAFNSSTGVSDTGGTNGIAGTGNFITENSIFSNGGIQLNLGGDLGLVLNDPSPDTRRHPELPGPQLGRRLRHRDSGARGPRQRAKLELPPGVLRQQRAGRKFLPGRVRRGQDVPRHDQRDDRRERPRELLGQPPRRAGRPAVHNGHCDQYYRHRLRPAQQHFRSPPSPSWAGQASS